MDSTLAAQVRDVARRRGMTQRGLIEVALHQHLMEDTAARTESDMAPLINQLIQEQHQVLGKGLRTLLVRIGYEVMRTQYVLLNFMARAGISDTQVEKWREEGWRYAVRELKAVPKLGEDDDQTGGG